MSDELAIALVILAGGLGLYLLGQSLIDAYFRRKERFVDSLNEKLKGKPNGSHD